MKSFLKNLELKLKDKPKRRVVLFAARVARLVYDQMEDECSREAVDAAELWALGLISDEEMEEKRKKAATAAYAAYATYATYAAYAAAYAAYATYATYAAYAAAYAARQVLKVNPSLQPQIKRIYHEIFHGHDTNDQTKEEFSNSPGVVAEGA